MSGLKKKKKREKEKIKGKVLGFESLGGKWKTCIQVNKKKKKMWENMHQTNLYLKSLNITQFY